VDEEVIYLVRHGQTHWNAEGRIQGQLDSNLTVDGIEQARAFGRLLRRHLPPGTQFRMESSPTGRAMATAQLVADELGIDHSTIRSTPLLAERHMGRWAGLTLDEVDRAFPGDEVRRTIDDWTFIPEGGESFEAMFARAHTWLASTRTSKVTVAVTHGLIGRTIRGAYLGLSPEAVVAGGHPQDRVFRLQGGSIEELLIDP
jgi:broad specificity phosphatase PhoE